MIGHDRIYTPEWVAQDMISFFRPSGRILEPCMGQGAIMKFLPATADWCEIEGGKDFFKHSGEYDWIISNPPFPIVRSFTAKAMEMSDNVVWLMPAVKYFAAWGFIKETERYGGLRNLRWYAGGGRLGFPMGNPIAAFHWQKKYEGETTISFWDQSIRSFR